MADPAAASLSLNERKALLALEKHGGRATPAALSSSAGLDEHELTSALNWLATKGLAQVEEQRTPYVVLGKEGEAYASEGLPERRAADAMKAKGGRATLGALFADGVIKESEVPIVLAWMRRKNWATIGKEAGETILTLVDDGPRSDGADERVLRALWPPGTRKRADELDKAGLEQLRSRQNVVRVHDETVRRFAPTDEGRRVARRGLTLQEEIVELTRDDIVSRKWEKTAVRPFDATTVVPPTHGGRPHPLVLLIEKIRDIFVEMGFQEIDGPFVESAFWNMDTLFIPQDHPAREMQDTFYLDNPPSLPVPDRLLKVVKGVQLTGGKTGSTGWGGAWNDDESKRALLRTHTTVTTIRYLSENPKPPGKVFGIGKVFRKEAIDATHLPEFHQVEGIVVEEGANFRMLQGVLGEFYRRMGFPQIKFRPSYYPYTEPSLDVAVKWGDRWLELGGAGIFRPEVTEPLGVPCPVLAWGLGLERLAMLTFKLSDIRQLYISDVDWLRKAPVVLPSTS